LPAGEPQAAVFGPPLRGVGSRRAPRSRALSRPPLVTVHPAGSGRTHCSNRRSCKLGGRESVRGTLSRLSLPRPLLGLGRDGKRGNAAPTFLLPREWFGARENTRGGWCPSGFGAWLKTLGEAPGTELMAERALVETRPLGYSQNPPIIIGLASIPTGKLSCGSATQQ